MKVCCLQCMVCAIMQCALVIQCTFAVDAICRVKLTIVIMFSYFLRVFSNKIACNR